MMNLQINFIRMHILNNMIPPGPSKNIWAAQKLLSNNQEKMYKFSKMNTEVQSVINHNYKNQQRKGKNIT